MIYRFSIILIFLSQGLSAQLITQISSAWDDSFNEWIVFTDDEDLEGKIELKWKLRRDSREWEYELGEFSGQIKPIWNDDSNGWELVPYDGSGLIEMKTVWKNDFSEWNIRVGKKTYRLKSKDKTWRSFWSINHSETEEFHIYMTEDGDPRDWLVEDYIEEGSLHLTIGISFISILNFSLQ